MKYYLESRLPSYNEYFNLCGSVGWGEIINFSVAEKSLENSIYSVIVRDDDDNTIGMGRIVGDGAIYFYIQDIVVEPQYQNRGIGTEILNNIFSWLKNNAPSQSFIALFATAEAESFYKKYTLEKRDLIGLFTVREIINDQLSDI